MIQTQKKQFICIGLIFIFLFSFLSIQLISAGDKISRLDNSPIASLAGPQISNVQITPGKPEWYDNISITAQITDPWGILEFKINYRADDDAYAGWGANFTMTHVENDQYQYIIRNSIWSSPQVAFGSHVNFTIYAKNGKGVWSRSAYYHFYMNDTVKPIIRTFTMTNNTWVSHKIRINVSLIEEGSGLNRVNLSIYMGNGTLYKTFTSTTLNSTFLWDVTSLPDYNISKHSSYFTINLTAWDKSIPFNKVTVILGSIRVDNTKPSLISINSYKNLTTVCVDNRTITTNVISASRFTNNYTKTYTNDGVFHSFYNSSQGFLQASYGFNLSKWNITSEMLKTMSISFKGKIGYANSFILAAGWKIWNWIGKNFTIIDSRILNSTMDVYDTFYITSSNKSRFINSIANQRIEIFFYINTTGPAINVSIDLIRYNISYYKTDEWYNRANQNITLQIFGADSLSFDHMDLHYKNQTFYRWNSSGEYFIKFNTTTLPDGLVPLNLTVYDKAGNANSSRILLNVDYYGPIVSILSPFNNSVIGSTPLAPGGGIWNIIFPMRISGYDVARNFRKMELWIDGQLAPVFPGQLGQITEYDEYGNVIYEQTNATWFKEGTYSYYWNASLLPHGSKHQLLIRSYDGFGNPNENITYVTMANYRTNISVIVMQQNYSITSDFAVTLEFRLTNYGNSTLQNFLPQVIIPADWDWNFKDIDYNQFNYLSPGHSLTFKVQIIPRSVKSSINQSIIVFINCRIVENQTQSFNNYTIQLTAYLTVQPQNTWQKSSATYLLLMSIASGFGIGLVSYLLYQYLREVSKQPSKPIEKPKKEK